MTAPSPYGPFAPRVRNRFLVPVLAGLAVLLGLAGLGTLLPPPPDGGEGGVILTATDGRSRIRVPAGWTVQDLHDAAEIEAGNRVENRYVMVLTDAKADLAKPDVRTFTGTVLDRLTEDLEGADVSPPRTFTLGGLPAIEHEIRGTAEGLNLVYWQTGIEGRDHLYQLLAWTTVSRAEEFRPVARRIAESFEETAR